MADQLRGLDAIKRWNDARTAFHIARDEFDAAREALHVARIEVAAAHKHACELNPDRAHLFDWFGALYGDRDQILSAVHAKGQSNG